MSTLRHPKAERGFMPLARRDMLKIGASAAGSTLVATPIDTRAAAPTTDTDLFAFRASNAAVVFAVTFPVVDGALRASIPAVRFHAGVRSWTLASTTPSVTLPLAGGARGFVGRTTRLTVEGAKPYNLIVLAAPLAAVPYGEIGVWAEVMGDGGTRRRVGNPMVAEILSQDPALARVFHRALPMDDKALFAEALSARIAARGCDGAALDPTAHGERLAAMLLPDVLSFNPRKPVGYTFAAQNGRQPSDQVRDIVRTVLAGVVTPPASTGGPFRAAKTFPYFETSVT